MKNTTKALLALLSIFALSAMCAGGALPFAGTVGTPEDRVEARATGTAIAPAIVPTVRYNEVVLPTQQAVEADEIEQTTRRQYDNARAWDDFKASCKKVALGGLTIFGAIATASTGGSIIGLAICFVWERFKRAKAFEPFQVVPDKALVFPRHLMIADPRTGRTWKITTEHKAIEDSAHGRFLIETKTGKKKATFSVVPRNGERHPQHVELLEAFSE